jgi:hypothetical protein
VVRNLGTVVLRRSQGPVKGDEAAVAFLNKQFSRVEIEILVLDDILLQTCLVPPIQALCCLNEFVAKAAMYWRDGEFVSLKTRSVSAPVSRNAFGTVYSATVYSAFGS